MGVAQELPIEQLPAYLQTLVDRLGGMSFAEPLKRRCAESVRSFTKQNFSKGQGPNGEAWRPLMNPRPRGAGGQKPLRDTGLLMASVIAKGGKGSVEQVTDSSLVIGTNLDRAAIHQYGGVVRPKGGRALAIPLTRQAVTAGSPRRMPGLVLVWPKGSKAGWLQTAPQGRKKVVRHFLLVAKVTIPARPFLGWNSDMADEQAAIIGEYAEQQLAKV